jgi:glycosyltransferase involved in cell wall biosynthesis
MKSHNNDIAAIIPAYNEGTTISDVLSILRQAACLKEIIVINDGSTDNTLEVVRCTAALEPRLRVVNLQPNQGKGQALKAGFQSVNTPLFLMLDADLRNLRTEHIDQLVEPVISGQLAMTVGVFRGGKFATDLAHWLTPWLSGQRCLRRELVQQIPTEASKGYGFETALTLTAQMGRWSYRYIPMRGVSHPPSEFHRGFRKGLKNRASMYYQIISAWFQLRAGYRQAELARPGKKEMIK